LQFIDVVDAAVAVGVGILLTENRDETLTVGDATHMRVEQSQQSYWNEGSWNLNLYDILKTVLENLVASVWLVLSDSATADDMLFLSIGSLSIIDGRATAFPGRLDDVRGSPYSR
jgi:hypothetical protein